MTVTGWDHPATAAYYEEFCVRHDRYQAANQALVRAAALTPDLEVLDLAAGTGRTAEGALAAGVSVTCFEPARAMRETGRRRVPDCDWVAHWPRARRFHRILCGAALWQMRPFAELFARAWTSLHPGGALIFDIPSLYLGEPDPPGGGRDPYLVELMARLTQGRVNLAEAWEPLGTAESMDALLREAGFEPVRWSFRAVLTQTAYRDWIKIPVITDAVLRDCAPELRARLIDEAFAACDPESWRWETWSGWTAYRVD